MTTRPTDEYTIYTAEPPFDCGICGREVRRGWTTIMDPRNKSLTADRIMERVNGAWQVHRCKQPRKVVPIVALLVALLLPSLAPAEYLDSLSSSHPRLFCDSLEFVEIAKRCTSGGTHASYRYELNRTCRDRYNQATVNNAYYGFEVSYAMLSRIYREWDAMGHSPATNWDSLATAYQTKAIELLDFQTNWGEDITLNVMRCWAVDLLWNQLTQNQRESYAAASVNQFSNGPFNDSKIANIKRGGHLTREAVRLARSAVFAGTPNLGSQWGTEFNGACNIFENELAPYYAFEGGPSCNGPTYATGTEWAIWWIAAMFHETTNINPYAITDTSSGRTFETAMLNRSKWLYYSPTPYTGLLPAYEGECRDYEYNDATLNIAYPASAAPDSFNQARTDSRITSMNAAGTTNLIRAYLALPLFWYNPDVTAMTLAAQPRVAKLGGATYYRSSWDDTNVTKVNVYGEWYPTYGHAIHLAGSEVIERNGDIQPHIGFRTDGEIYSGGYNHMYNFLDNSIAGSGLWVYQPGEPYAYTTESVNSGRPNHGGHVSLSNEGYDKFRQYQSVYRSGINRKWEWVENQYLYTQVDVTNGFDREQWAALRSYGPAVNNKLEWATYECVVVDDTSGADSNMVIVAHKARKTNTTYIAGINFPSKTEPSMDSTMTVRAGTEADGISESAPSGFQVVDDHPSRGGPGILIYPLVPSTGFVRKMGGERFNDYAYRTDGQAADSRYDPAGINWASNRIPATARSGISSSLQGVENRMQDTLVNVATGNASTYGAFVTGWGRVEFVDSARVLNNSFLAIKWPQPDTSVTSLDVTGYESEYAMAARIPNKWCFAFSRYDTANVDTLHYELAATDTTSTHHVYNLQPDSSYVIHRGTTDMYIYRSTFAAPASTTPMDTVTATSAGVVSFVDNAPVTTLPTIAVSAVASRYVGVISNEAPTAGFDVEITWTTDIPSKTQINYGATDNYGSSTVEKTALVTSHSDTLSYSAVASGVTTYIQCVSARSGYTTGTSADSVQITVELPAGGQVEGER